MPPRSTPAPSAATRRRAARRPPGRARRVRGSRSRKVSGRQVVVAGCVDPAERVLNGETVARETKVCVKAERRPRGSKDDRWLGGGRPRTGVAPTALSDPEGARTRRDAIATASPRRPRTRARARSAVAAERRSRREACPAGRRRAAPEPGRAPSSSGVGVVAALVGRAVVEGPLERVELAGHRIVSSPFSRRRSDAVAALASFRAPFAVIPITIAIRSYDRSAR